MKRVLIEGGHVLTMNAANDTFPNGCVLIEGDRILYVGPSEGVPYAHVDERIAVPSHAVLPGLVNGHTHLCMTFGRTLGTNVDLLSWLDLQIPIIRALDEDALYAAEMLGCIENLKNGNTSLVENMFAPRTALHDPSETVFCALRDSGIRGTLARAHECRNFAEDFVETMDQVSAELTHLAGRWHHSTDERLRLACGPLLPWAMTEEALRATRAVADRLGIGIHMHVAESPDFNSHVATHFGRPVRQIELLHETGCLGPDVQATGVSDVSAEELKLLADTNTAVIFDPTTRLFWGTGFPSLQPFLESGIPCGLSTNGPAANCGQDLFESMKYACATAKTATNDPTTLSASRALRMATIEGARAIGLGDQTGSLEVGKRADVITMDLAQPHFTPAHDLEAALVFCGRGSDVKNVFVDGRCLVRDRQIQFLDESAFLRQATSFAAQALERALATQH